ncbi:MAG: hypothetical protein A3K50_12290 [Planctomycetes bacterium RIFOXYD12_FULL_42_12]|nr:MAG: hypothetical protein A3K50_12290 [Planctomycetes bacterium RIFOXYD12_FULL_42_12]
MNEELITTHKIYHRSLPMTLLQQLVFLIAIIRIDWQGLGITIFMNALVLYWVVFFICRKRRPTTPTNADIFIITWGTFLIFTFSILCCPAFWQHYAQFL